jgi:hypothetical protein
VDFGLLPPEADAAVKPLLERIELGLCGRLIEVLGAGIRLHQRTPDGTALSKPLRCRHAQSLATQDYHLQYCCSESISQ